MTGVILVPKCPAWFCEMITQKDLDF